MNWSERTTPWSGRTLTHELVRDDLSWGITNNNPPTPLPSIGLRGPVISWSHPPLIPPMVREDHPSGLRRLVMGRIQASNDLVRPRLQDQCGFKFQNK